MKRFEQMLNAEIAALKKSQRYACEHCNDPRCACEVDASRSDLRVAIFNDIRSAVLQPESFRKTAVGYRFAYQCPFFIFLPNVKTLYLNYTYASSLS